MSQALDTPSFEVLFWTAQQHALCLGRHPVAARFGPVAYRDLRRWMHEASHMSAGSAMCDYIVTGKLTYAGLPVLRMRAEGVAIVTGPWKPKY